MRPRRGRPERIPSEVIQELRLIENLDRIRVQMQGKTLQDAIRILIRAKDNEEICDSQFMLELRNLVQ